MKWFPRKHTNTFCFSSGETRNTDLKGVFFQLDLLTVFMLNALRGQKNWRISTEKADAGNFDDIVFETPNAAAVLAQVKFKQNVKTVSKEQFLSINSKKANFSLPRYFFSYQEVKNRYNVKNLIICTNVNVDQKSLRNFITFRHIKPDSMLFYEDNECAYFTFNENILPELKENLKRYHDHFKSEKLEEATITEENINDFLNILHIFPNYPSGKKMNVVIERLLSRLNDSALTQETSSQEIYRKVEDWYKQHRQIYLTESRAEAMFCERHSDKYCESLGRHNLMFKDNFYFTDTTSTFHVKSAGGHWLQMAKIHRTLEGDKCKKLFIGPGESREVQMQMIKAFELPYYKYLVMVWSDTAEQVSNKLRQILNRYKYKKVIILSDDGSTPSKFDEFEELDGHIKFEDLSKGSQERLLKSKNIAFQGQKISLKELFAPQMTENYSELLNPETLEKLVRGELFNVGVPVLSLDEDTTRYYIGRKFARDSVRQNYISEKNVYNETKKLAIIAGDVGIGKSTVLANLAATIKQSNPELWVIRIKLRDYTGILRNCLTKKMKRINAMELLNSEETTKLTSEFEKSIFSTNGKVVLLLDGVDEISPDYTDLILDLLRQCLDASNFAKIFITTRLHLTQKLEKILKTESLRMVPLTKSNQRDFLKKYWMHTLNLNKTDINKCKEYAKVLLFEMSLWLNSYKEGDFTAIPLHVRIVAEVFQECTASDESMNWLGCKEYLSSDQADPTFPARFNMAKLYDVFIEKKRDIFIRKENPSGNMIAHQVLLNEFNRVLDYHRCLALDLFLDKTESQLFSHYQSGGENVEVCVLKIGIAQKSRDKLRFVHGTLEEYFVAQSILTELKSKNENVDFQRMVIDKVLTDSHFKTVRTFLEDLLREGIDDLPPNIFEKYRSSYENTSTSNDIIFILSKEGCVAILQLILKNVKLKNINGATFKITNFFNRIFRKTNTLNRLEIIMAEYGVNFRDRKGNMPLHYAAERGHLDMVKFLVAQGADVNSVNGNNETPLDLANKFKKYRWRNVSAGFDNLQALVNWSVVNNSVGRGLDVNYGYCSGARYCSRQPRNIP